MGAPPSVRGVGDRWLAGERLSGVEYALHDRVVITAGAHEGATGAVALLAALHPEPAYVVTLAASTRPVRVRQSVLRAAP